MTNLKNVAKATITKKITTSVETDVQIELPYFAKSSAYYYKVVDESHCIVVFRGYNDTTIGLEYRDTINSAIDPSRELGNEEEFNEWLNIVTKKMTDLNNY